MRKISFEAPTVKTRHGVPAALASRYVTRTVRPKKGKGSYSRKGRPT